MARFLVAERRPSDDLGTHAGAQQSTSSASAVVRRGYVRPEVRGHSLTSVVRGGGTKTPDAKTTRGQN